MNPSAAPPSPPRPPATARVAPAPAAPAGEPADEDLDPEEDVAPNLGGEDRMQDA